MAQIGIAGIARGLVGESGLQQGQSPGKYHPGPCSLAH
jgi:hypothetical protein